MLLSDAFHELSTELDVLYNATQGRLFTRLARQLSRLSQCEESLRFAVLKNGLVVADQRRHAETLAHELEDAHAKHKRLHARAQQERHERQEEKEWIAALWPDGVVLPTILKVYEEEENHRYVHQVEVQDERQRLEALVGRRAAKERVLQQIETAAQWRIVVVPPSTTPEGEYVAGQTFYQNATTGESSWDAPIVMFYEPPVHWDATKMDWKESYALENFYPVKETAHDVADDAHATPRRGDESTDVAPVGPETQPPQAGPPRQRRQDTDDDSDRDSHDVSSDDDCDGGDSNAGAKRNTAAREADEDDNDGDGDDEQPADPATLRAELERAFERAKDLQDQLDRSAAEQRALSLQLLNTTRDSFEREQEELEKEDEQVKEVERQRRRAQQQEEAAAKAAAQAAERKTMDKVVQPKFARDSVAKKDMTLAKDDEHFARELQAFAVEQRADRMYLAAPLACDPRVKFRHQLDDEFVHMKHMEQLLLTVERTEFDLLEKTALRVEEAAARCEELAELLAKARATDAETEAELLRLPVLIEELEEAQPPPSEPRPLEEDLERAKERFVGAEGEAGSDDETSGEVEEEGVGRAEHGDPRRERGEVANDEQEEEEEDSDAAQATKPTPARVQSELDPAALTRDEAELRHLRHAVELDRAWRDWELAEMLRLEDLAAAYDRFKALESLRRRLQVDVALFASDLAFFEQLAAQEKALHARLWAVQASAQVERARFLVERAAREESLFQVSDEYEAVARRLEEARRLPRQASNPLEKLELLALSTRQAEQLQTQLAALRARHEKEQAARALLVALETRFCEYSQQKLQEEAALFAEKQALWDANARLHDELRAFRDVVEHLFSVLQGDADAPTAEAETRARYDEFTAVFEEKLERVEAVRQFLLLCYARETRWRALAAVALVRDTTSDQWMTEAQRARQEQTLAVLQQQHEQQQLALRREIKLQTKVMAVLRAQLQERDAKIESLRAEYQRSSEAVRLETQQIVFGLSDHLQDEQRARATERARAKEIRARLVADHAALAAALQQRVAVLEDENERQRHWLTAAKRELHAQRVANEELLTGYASLEKRRATETNDMRFRIAAQITKINGIEMWNLSLKIQAREAHAERVATQRGLERLVLHHKQQQRLLRHENWRHRVAAQAILTDVDALFRFFADGIEILAGATPETNAALRRNGGIELLAALAQHSHHDDVRVIAAQALGLVAWDAHATPRALGWQAKKLWFTWQAREAARVESLLAARSLAFDGVASEDAAEINWLADTAAAAGESDVDAVASASKKIRFLRLWNARADAAAARASVNADNQQYIGLAPGVLKTLLDLCRRPPPTAAPHSEDVAVAIQRNALRSLAIVAMDTRNTAVVGRMDGCIELLVALLRGGGHDDAGVERHAIQALANLAFQNRANQSAIVRAGAVPLLLANAARHADVDVLLVSVQALACLSFEHAPCCAAIFDLCGVATLTRLCHSFRIHDAVDLDVFETVQACAAETIANVVTTLDEFDGSDEPQQQDRAVVRNVPLTVLSASETLEDENDHGAAARPPPHAPPGVATFVLMCASCTRDVAFHGALVLGSIAQHDDVRAAIGASGGVDALFLLAARRDDPPLVAQATWALANATWNRENQYRVARYLDALFALCTFRADDASANASNQQQQPQQNDDGDDADDADDAACSEQIREHALCVAANALFYNDANRVLVASQPAWMALLAHLCRAARPGPALEHAARALCSLSYCDRVALAMGGHTDDGEDGMDAALLAPARAVPALALFVRLCGVRENALVQRHALNGLINMCLHDANKAALLAVAHGVETLVNLSGSTDRALSDAALEALDLLADVRPLQDTLVGGGRAAVLSPSTMGALAASDLKKLIAVLQDAGAGSAALVAMACDAIADEVWKRPSSKVRLRNEHGLDALLALCVGDAGGDGGHPPRVLLSCLWALRNSVADNARNQDYVGARRGVPRLVALLDRRQRLHRSSSDELVEAALAALVALVAAHPRNSQELVEHGVDTLLALAEGGEKEKEKEEEEEEEEVARRESGSVSPSTRNPAAAAKMPSRENRALARELLLLVAPYSAAANTPPPQALPPLGGAKASASSPKKKPHTTTTTTNASSPSLVRLPLLAGSPLAAPLSPTKQRGAPSNN